MDDARLIPLGLVVATMLAGGVAADVIDDCALIPNGSFNAATSGWTITDEEDADGDAQAATGFGLMDGSDWAGGGGTSFDTSVLALQVSATAGLDGGPGGATAEVTVATTVAATGRRLRVRKGGSFELQYLGAGGHEFSALVRVTRADGRFVAAALYETREGPGIACFPGYSILGSFDVTGPTVLLDLGPSGIEAGEEVTVSVRLRAYAAAAHPCQWSHAAALLIVDEFEFCGAFPGPGDLDGDGAVGHGDLVLLLAAWGACPAPPATCGADLDDDGAVGYGDLLLLLASWS